MGNINGIKRKQMLNSNIKEGCINRVNRIQGIVVNKQSIIKDNSFFNIYCLFDNLENKKYSSFSVFIIKP